MFPPLVSREDHEKLEKRVQARAKLSGYYDKFKFLHRMKPVLYNASLPSTTATRENLIGPGTWTHIPSEVGYPENKVQSVIARSLRTSAPVHAAPLDPNNFPGALDEWYRLLGVLSEPDSSGSKDTFQRLTTLRESITEDPNVRLAIGEVIASHERLLGPYISLLSRIFDKYKSDISPAEQERLKNNPNLQLALFGDGKDIGNSCTVSIFLKEYNAATGAKILAAAERVPREKTKLTNATNTIAKSEVWRKAIIDMCTRSNIEGLEAELGAWHEGMPAPTISDPFLDYLVKSFADQGHFEDVIGSPALMGSLTFSENVTKYLLESMLSKSHPNYGISIPEDVVATFGPLITRTELPPLLTLKATQVLLQKLNHLHNGRNKVGSYSAMSYALVISRLREELAYRVLQREGMLSNALVTVPANPMAMQLAEDAINLLGARNVRLGKNGPLEIANALRQMAIYYFYGKNARNDFFPGEDNIIFLGDMENGGAKGIPVREAAKPRVLLEGFVGDEEAEAATRGVGGLEELAEKTFENSYLASGCAVPLSSHDVMSIIRMLSALSPFLLNKAMIEQLTDQIASANTEIARLRAQEISLATETKRQNIQEELASHEGIVQAVTSTLHASSIIASIMTTADVVSMLLSLLFAPMNAIDAAALRLLQNEGIDNHQEVIALTLLWIIEKISCRKEFLAPDPDNWLHYLSSSVPDIEADVEKPQYAPVSDPCLFGNSLSLPMSDGLLGKCIAENTESVKATSVDMSAIDAKHCFAVQLLSIAELCASNGPYLEALKRIDEATAAGREARDTLAQTEAMLVLHASAHPMYAAGIIHWMRQTLASPNLSQDTKLLRAGLGFGKMAILISQRWPLLCATILSLLKQCVYLKPKFATANELMPFRKAIGSILADFLLSTGYDIPVFRFLQKGLDDNFNISAATVQSFISRCALALYTNPNSEEAQYPSKADSSLSPYSVEFTTAFLSVLHSFQLRITQAHAQSAAVVTQKFPSVAESEAQDAVKSVVIEMSSVMGAKELALTAGIILAHVDDNGNPIENVVIPGAFAGPFGGLPCIDGGHQGIVRSHDVLRILELLSKIEATMIANGNIL